MSNQEISIQKIPVTGPNGVNTVEVKISYNIGGMNYFQGAVETRGMYLHCTPYEKYDGGKVYRGFSGVKQIVMEVGRFSQKKLEQAVAEVDKDLVEQMIAHVIAKNSLKKVEE